MMKVTVVAIALLSASGAAAQVYEPEADLISEERLAELKAQHAALLTSVLAFPDVAKRTPEYKAMREEWIDPPRLVALDGAGARQPTADTADQRQVAFAVATVT